MSDYVSIGEAAAMCDCGRGFILANIRRGILTGREAAGTFVLPLVDVKAFQADIVHVRTGKRLVTKYVGSIKPANPPRKVWGRDLPPLVPSKSRKRPAPPAPRTRIHVRKAPAAVEVPMTVAEVISKAPLPEEI